LSVTIGTVVGTSARRGHGAPPQAGRRHGPRGRRSLLPAVWGAALMAAGLGALLVASALQPAGPRLAGANTAIGQGADDPRDISAHNSPTVVANPADPANLAVVNRVDSPTFSCALHVSFDAGASWQQTPVPFPEGEELPERCFAPDAVFTADGTLHVSFVTLAGRGNVPHAVWVASSPDGGAGLGQPVRAGGPQAFQVRLAADPTDADRLYLSWVQAGEVGPLGFPEAANPVQVSRSDDAGATWSAPVAVNDPARLRVLAPSTAVGDDGAVYVLYLDLRDDRLDYHGAHEGRGGPAYPGPWSLVLARSDDGGATWRETVVDDALVPAERIVAFFPPSPSLAVHGERVYAAFHDARGGGADVWLWASADAGASFGPPRRVNDTPAHDATWQYLPAVAVAPGGRVDVAYYDRRADAGNVMNEVSLQSSRDAGRTFGPHLRLSDRAFDSRIGFGSERGLPDLGSRLGLVSTDRGSLAVWADTRAGTEASNKQVLAQAVAVHAAAPLPPGPLRVGGLAAVIAGLAALLWWASGAAGSRRQPPAATPPAAGNPWAASQVGGDVSSGEVVTGDPGRGARRQRETT